MKKIIVTGGAGFIGSNLCDSLLKENWDVTCIDNFDDYYNQSIKRENISEALSNKNFKMIEADIHDYKKIKKSLNGEYEAIIHLAAKAGVRYSISHPIGYEESNVQGTKKILDLAINHNIKQFVFSSSSSVYGDSPKPFIETNFNLTPTSPYAQTKLLSETLGKEYAEKFGINFISLRFFSVYGPRLRPDLLMNKIARNIYFNEKLCIFGDGSTSRDYTYVDDIILGILNAISYHGNNFEIFNLGSGKPIKLSKIIDIFENISLKKVKIENVDSIKGESNITWADNIKAKELLDFNANTNIVDGIEHYIEWFCKKEKITFPTR